MTSYQQQYDYTAEPVPEECPECGAGIGYEAVKDVYFCTDHDCEWTCDATPDYSEPERDGYDGILGDT